MSLLGVVPYTWRHSAPSIDRAQRRRSLQEVKKRGWWRQPKSVNRYEKAGRLGMSVRELASEQVAFREHDEPHLGYFICGCRTPLLRFRQVACMGYFADVFAGFAPVGRRLLLEGADVRIWELGLGEAGNICMVNNLK